MCSDCGVVEGVSLKDLKDIVELALGTRAAFVLVFLCSCVMCWHICVCVRERERKEAACVCMYACLRSCELVASAHQ